MKTTITLFLCIYSYVVSAQSNTKNSNEIYSEIFGQKLFINDDFEKVHKAIINNGGILQKEEKNFNSYKNVMFLGKYPSSLSNVMKKKDSFKGIITGVSLSEVSQLKLGMIESEILENIETKIIQLFGKPDELNLTNEKQGIICNKWNLGNNNILLLGSMLNKKATLFYFGDKKEAPSVE
jgi:hypothetical protein